MTSRNGKTPLPDKVIDELFECMNQSEMAKRQFQKLQELLVLSFRDIGAQKSVKQLQASGGLFFDVFAKYDPDNLLLTQARGSTERQLEAKRLINKLMEIQTQSFILKKPKNLTPFSFPLWAESLRTQVSSESWSERVQKMALDLENRTRNEK